VTQTVTEVGRHNGKRLLRITETGAANTGLYFSWKPYYTGRLLSLQAVYSAAPTHAGVQGYVGRPLDQIDITSGAGATQARGISAFDPFTNVATMDGEWRSNLVYPSADFGSWAQSPAANSTVLSDAIANPLDGALTADKVVPNTNVVVHQVYKTFAGATSTSYVRSQYFKWDGSTTFNWILVLLGNTGFGGDNGIWYSFAEQGYGTGGPYTVGTPDDYGFENLDDGWVRIWVEKQSIGGAGTYVAGFYPGDDVGASKAGNDAAGIYTYGAQVEARTGGPGDYIATSGAAIAPPGATSVYSVTDDGGGTPTIGTAAAAGASTITLATNPTFGHQILSGSANARYTVTNPKGGAVIGENERVAVLAPAGGAGITASVAAYVEV
jgi:hypothetical protein